MPQEAEAHYRAALRVDPESAGAHINLANLHAAQKKYPEAIDHYREAPSFSRRRPPSTLGWLIRSQRPVAAPRRWSNTRRL
jgi:tetratricopeptide (TPR) repeat protein